MKIMLIDGGTIGGYETCLPFVTKTHISVLKKLLKTAELKFIGKLNVNTGGHRLTPCHFVLC